LRVGSAAALAKAINDEANNDEATAGAEVRLLWRARK